MTDREGVETFISDLEEFLYSERNLDKNLDDIRLDIYYILGRLQEIASDSVIEYMERIIESGDRKEKFLQEKHQKSANIHANL